MDDNKIINLVLQGQTNKYGELMNTYHNEIFTYVFNVIGQYQETEDVVQDIFLKVYKNLKKFDSSKASFRTWLYRISNNHVLNHIQSKNYKTHRNTIEYEDRYETEENVEKDLEKEEQIKQIVQAIKKVLKPKHQEIVTLHYFSELSVKEISDVTAIPEKTIYNALKSSIEKIKKEVL